MAVKLCKMTVTVAIDEDLPVGLVHQQTREALGSLGTCTITIPPAPVDAAVPPPADGPELVTTDRVGRIHWPTVEVVQQVTVTRASGAGQRAPRKVAAAS